MRKGKNRIVWQQLTGVIVLVALFAVVMTVVHFLPERPQKEVKNTWVDSVAQTTKRGKKHTDYKKNQTVQQRLHMFDPNTADSLSLREVGLKSWQVRNLMKYRHAGGTFRRAEDFSRLYGLSDSAYQALKPYIQIDTARLNQYRLHHTRRDSVFRDSLFPKYVSHKKDTILELNTTDTSELQLIRGIGPYTAECIVRYRDQLGGYYCAEQIREIEGLDGSQLDSIIPHLTADEQWIRRIPVNQSSVRRLQRHPYISFTQAKAIYEWRRRHYELHSIDDLYEIKELSEDDLQRLVHYLSFDKSQ